ncbi:MAG: hypothetical protein QXU18_05290, partial [Thermoplasmatales archaeon]
MHRYPPESKFSLSDFDSKRESNSTNNGQNFEQLEKYLINPYVQVEILREGRSGRLLYRVTTEELGKTEAEELEALKKLFLKILGEISPPPLQSEMEGFIRKEITMYFENEGKVIGERALSHIQYLLTRDFLGYGKIDPIMNDSNIEDISCDGVKIPIYVYHKKYQNIKTNLKFDDERELDNFIVLLAQKGNRQISISDPLLDASTPEGNRINATFGNEVTTRGGTFSIRLFKHAPF